jgi:hypothetical protein
MKFYQEGLDWKPKSISQWGGDYALDVDQSIQTIDNVFEVMSAPQKGTVRALTGKYQMPSKALGMQEDSWGSEAVDFFTDPSTYLGGSLFKKGIGVASKVASKVGKGASKLSKAVDTFKKDFVQGYKGVPTREDGGIIKDDRGQWEYPGEITKINSNQITMQGVDYPVLGISDTGDTQMMQPGQDYTYEGESVTEYPMAQGGRVIRKNTRDTNVLEDATKWYQDNTKDKDWLEITDDILSAPQRAATYAITGALTGDPKYINPSDALNIQNKWGKLATDIVLDPTNLLGIGLASKLGKIAKGAKTIEKTKTVFNKPVAEAMSTLLKTPAGVSARGFLGGRKFSSAAKPFWKEYDKLLAQVWKKETVTEALKLGAKDGIGSVAIINDLIQKYPSKKEEILNITNTSLLKKDNNLLLKNKKELGNKPKIIENKSSIKNSNQKITYKENPESISSLTMLNKPETKKDVKPDNTMVQLMPFGLVPKYKVDSLNNIGYKRAIGNSYINSGGMETYGPDSSDAIKKGLNLPSTKGKQKNGGWLSKYN